MGNAKISKQMLGGVCVLVKSLGILVKHVGTLQAKHNMFMY